MVTIKRNCLDAETFRSLTESAGWGKPPVEQVKTALAHSFVTVCAYENAKAVGMARMLGDGALSYFVKDVVVRPDCQQRGIGRQLMEELMNCIREQSHPGWKVSVELMSAKGKEPFYEKLGFEPRPSEHGGCGMFLFLEIV